MFVNNSMIKIGDSVFYEIINVKKLKYIIKNRDRYDATIKKHEKNMRRLNKHYDAFASFEKILDNVIIPPELQGTDYAYIKVSYNKGKNSNGIGRWYCKLGLGIQNLCVPARHTTCCKLWIDIDMVNCHIVILNQLLEKHSFQSSLLTECVNDRENILKRVMKDENCDRDAAKTLIIAVINGGKYSSPTLKQLAEEIKPGISHIINLSEYKEINDDVNKTYKDNIEGKTISRILQVIENDLLETQIEFFKEKGFVKKFNDGYEISLIFDGFQLRYDDRINQDLLNECSTYALKTTGYNLELKIKPFDNQLDLPEDFEVYDYGDIEELVCYYKLKTNNCVEKYLDDISKCFFAKGHTCLASFTKKLFNNSVVYDDECESWFFTNPNNIWIKQKSSIILKRLLADVIGDVFQDASNYFKQLANNDETEEIKRAVYLNCSKESYKLSLKLKTSSYLSAMSETAKGYFLVNKFYEQKIDTNCNLFAFRNKVLDCRTCEIRNIKPNDYIMINTNYDYPEYVDEDLKTMIEKYYETIYPDEDVRNYMWFNDSLTLNGERPFQTFLLHTGSGSNSKSTKFSMLKSALGDYFLEVNAETFTRPKASNGTSELYKAKGTRLVSFEEPNNQGEDKLQANTIKKLADGHTNTCKTRELFKNAVEFKISFRVEGCCNNKPQLTSTDGGSGRRIRVIEYLTKFVAEPDPNNKYQALLDPDMNALLCSKEIRNTYIRMLVDYFINVSSKIKVEKIPKQIKDDSNSYIDDSNPVLGFIIEDYEITNNTDDKIQASILYDRFKRKDPSIKMDRSEFKTKILELGITNGRETSGKNKGQIFYYGVKERKNDNEDDE